MRSNNRFSRSRNPLLNERRIARAVVTTAEPLDGSMPRVAERPMTVSGAVNKSLILGIILMTSSIIGWMFASQFLAIGGAIVGLVIVLVAAWKPHLSPILAPIYAAVEGLFVGAISVLLAGLAGNTGIIFQAVLLTMAVFFTMLFLYKSGYIKVTQKLRTGVIMATGAIFFMYILSWILSMFDIAIPYLHTSGPIGIGISLLIIGVAAFNLLLDFDNFDKGEAMRAPAYMEWYFAMGLIITIVWLYIEILRLVAIISSSD